MAQSFPFTRDKIANDFPYDPFERSGDESDGTYYVLEPGSNFLRPWISIPGGIAFVFPLGLQGFSVSIDPVLGIHRFIGDNKVAVDVIHRGEERMTMRGSFPGSSAVSAFRALREVVYAATPQVGKIVFVPHLLPYAQRMVVASARFDHGDDDHGTDLTYDIEFVRLGPAQAIDSPIQAADPQPERPSANSAKFFVSNSKYNSLRKIAVLKKTTWNRLYKLNAKYFRRKAIPALKVPDHRLPNGIRVYY